MARQGFIQNKHSFADGLVTEGNLLSGNQAVVRWAVNFHFKLTGEAHKRKGLQGEKENTPSFSTVTSGSPEPETKVWTFSNVEAMGFSGGDLSVFRGGRNLVVFPHGDSPFLSDVYAPVVLSEESSSLEEDLSLPTTFSGKMEIVKVSGRLLVLQPTSVRWIYKDPEDSKWKLSKSLVSQTDQKIYGGALVRDFEGVTDGLEVNEEPAILTQNHKYNLLNQGWTEDKILEYFHSEHTSGYPTNAQMWHEGKDDEDKFSPERLKRLNFGESPAAKGRGIISAITQDRSSVFPGVRPTLQAAAVGSPSTPYMYTTGASFGGRAAFGGCNIESARRKVFISPVLPNLRAYGTTDQEDQVIDEPGLLVAGGHGPIYWSEDGEKWTSSGSPDIQVRVIKYHPKLDVWVAIGTSSQLISSDGKDWRTFTTPAIPLSKVPSGIIADEKEDRFISVTPSAVAVSSDGSNWSRISSNVNGLTGIAYSKDLDIYVATANQTFSNPVGGVYTSKNLSVWTKVKDFGSGAIARDDKAGVFIIQEWPSFPTQRYGFWTSEDGETWVKRESLGRFTRQIAYSDRLNIWVAVSSDANNPNNERVWSAPSSGHPWTQRKNNGLEPRSVVFWEETDRFYLVNHNGNNHMYSEDGQTWHTFSGPQSFWAVEAKQPTFQTIVTDSVDDFFDRIFMFYQKNDPTAEISNEIHADDGVVVEISELDSIQKLASLANSLIVFSENGVWAITGPDLESGFRADEHMQYKVSSIGTRYPGSIIEADDAIYFWSDSGIYAVSINEMGRFDVSPISRGRIDDFYSRISPKFREKATGYHDSHNDKIVWAFYEGKDSQESGRKRNQLLILNLKTGGFETHVLPETVESSSSREVIPTVAGFIQDPSFPGEEGEIPLKILTGFNNDFYVNEFKGTDFTDYEGINKVRSQTYPAYIETWPDTLEEPAYRKQTSWVHTYLRRTETGFKESDGILVPENESGCTMQGIWDWHNTARGGKWGKPRNIYLRKKMYTPKDSNDPFDTGEEVIHTRGRVYGRGSSLSLRFESEEGKNTQILGYTVVYTAEGNP